MVTSTTTVRRHIISVEVIGDANLKRFQAQAEQVGARIRQLNASAGASVGAFGNLGRASGALTRNMQNVAFQIGDIAVQLASGTAATLALSQQIPQMLIGFGLWGAAIGALVGIGGALVRMLGNVGISGEAASQALGSFRPVVDGISAALTGLAGIGSSVFGALLDNLDRLLYTGTALASLLGVRLVAAFAVSGAAATALATTFGVLSASIVGILRVAPLLLAAFAIGELAHRFANLVRNVGGFGEALDALKGVAREVFEGIRTLGEGLGHALAAAWNRIAASFADALAVMRGYWADFVEYLSGQAAKLAVDVPLPFDLGSIDPFQGFADSMANAAASARENANSMADEAKRLGAAAEASAAAAKKAFGEGGGTIGDALKTLRDLTRDTSDATSDLATSFTEAGAAAGGAAAGIGAAAKEVAAVQKELSEAGNIISSSFNSAFKSIIDGTKSAADAFHEMILSMLADITAMLISRQFQEFLKALSGMAGFGWLAAPASAAGASTSPLVTAPQMAVPQMRAAGRTATMSFAAEAPAPRAPDGLGSNRALVLGQAAPASSDAAVNVVVNNNMGGRADVAVSESRDPTGQRTIDITIAERINHAIRSGAVDQTMAATYGLRRRAR